MMPGETQVQEQSSHTQQQQQSQTGLNSDSPASVEFISAGSGGLQGSGDISQRILESGGNVRRFAESMRGLGILREDEWRRVDETVLQVARDNLFITQRLVGRGLVYNLPEALGVMQLDWERVGDMGPASMQMSALVEGANDRIDFDMRSLPIPIIFKQFNLNVRHLAASRRGSTPIDVTMAALSGRKVSERIESLITTGSGDINFGASSLKIPGMLDAPDAVGVSGGDFSSGNTIGLDEFDFESFGEDRTKNLRYTGWTSGSPSSLVPEDLLSDVITQLKVLNTMNYFGPFAWYVPRSLYYAMQQDWSPNKGDGTIQERILKLPEISAILPANTIKDGPAGATLDKDSSKTVMIQETIDVVDIVNGIQPTTIQWAPAPGFVTSFMVFAIMVPRFKSTKARQTGIVIVHQGHA